MLAALWFTVGPAFADPPPPDPPPPKPVLVGDASEGLGLVMMVGSGAGELADELNRAGRLFNETLNTGTPITILTTVAAKPDVLTQFKGSGRVSIVEIPSGSDIFGGGFPRDNMPIPIRSTDAQNQTTWKYLVDEPQQGAKLADALVDAGLIAKGDLIKVPFHFEGGDITVGNGFLFVTDKFYQRNQTLKNLTEAQVNAFIQQYFGVDATKIVKLTSPPNEKTGHSDLLVRPLPGGKVVVSVSGSADMAADDKAALDANLQTVQQKVGANNTVQVKTATSDPTSSYANAIVSGKTVLIPKELGDAAADQAAKTAIQQALPDGYEVKTLDASDQCVKGGGPHCRVGNITLKSAPVKSAGAHKSPTIGFDAATGVLSMTSENLNLLASADTRFQNETDAQWLNDPLRAGDVLLELSAMQLEPLSNDPDFVTFSGGIVRLVRDGDLLFEAGLPALRFWRHVDDGFLDIFGVLEDSFFDNQIASPFLTDFMNTVLESRFFLDFYMLAPQDLFALSSDFTQSFDLELSGAGISFNANILNVPEPATVWLVAVGAFVVIVLGGLPVPFQARRYRYRR